MQINDTDNIDMPVEPNGLTVSVDADVQTEPAEESGDPNTDDPTGILVPVMEGDPERLTELLESQKLSEAVVLALLKETLDKDEVSFTADQANLTNYLADQKNCLDISNDFVDQLTAGIGTIQELINRSGSLISPDHFALDAGLQNRQQGLDLIGRMLARLTDKVHALREQEPKIVVLQRLDLSDIQDGLNVEAWGSEEALKLELNQRFKSVEYQRYKCISSANAEVMACRKHILSFVEKQLLPILDGIDDGERNSSLIINGLKLDHEEDASTLDTWFSVYETMRANLLTILAHVNIEKMEVSIGGIVDYLEHEPFDEEPDADLPNEHIKSVIRNGYIFSSLDIEAQVLRSAQVILVRNPEETSDC